jgi:hypothetical protein
VERLQDKFRAAHTQVLGVSVDSVHCHANWAASLGGVSFPLLADFHPKGEVARAFGLYLDQAGITDRATVIIDSEGVVRHASSVTPSGERDIDELLALCEEIDREYGGKLSALPGAPGLEGETQLYVKGGCGFSLRALNARDNLHLTDKVALRNISDDQEARAALVKLIDKVQVPCLVVDGKPMLESVDIVRYLADRIAPV